MTSGFGVSGRRRAAQHPTCEPESVEDEGGNADKIVGCGRKSLPMAMDKTTRESSARPHEVRAEYTDHPKFRKNNGIKLPRALREKTQRYTQSCSRWV
jgi:hypothetical protein